MEKSSQYIKGGGRFDMPQLYELLGENEAACREAGTFYLLLRGILTGFSSVVVCEVKYSQIVQ